LVAAMRDELTEVMKRLDATEQSITLLWLDGTTVSAISNVTGVPERTVARKLAKIRRILRDLGGEHSDVLSFRGISKSKG
jgi:DNA-directed RNA polymerase specialized sigma24 family protein